MGWSLFDIFALMDFDKAYHPVTRLSSYYTKLMAPLSSTSILEISVSVLIKDCVF